MVRGYIDPKVPYVFQKQLLNTERRYYYIVTLTLVILKLGMLSILFFLTKK